MRRIGVTLVDRALAAGYTEPQVDNICELFSARIAGTAHDEMEMRCSDLDDDDGQEHHRSKARMWDRRFLQVRGKLAKAGVKVMKYVPKTKTYTFKNKHGRVLKVQELEIEIQE